MSTRHPAPPGLRGALQALDAALDAPRRAGIPLGNWRWLVRQRMAAVRDALAGEAAGSDDGWLAARGGSAFRERNALLSRLAILGSPVLETPDVEATRIELKRLRRRHRPAHAAAARPGLRRGRDGARRLGVAGRRHLQSCGASGQARRGAGVADRNRLESGRWQRCQPRVRIPPPLPAQSR